MQHAISLLTLVQALMLFAVMNSEADVSAWDVVIQRTDRGAAVTADGDPFAEYLTRSGHQPVVWPIIGPGGQAMTRQYPLGERLATEKEDHPHHRSLWFNHGLVNGLDYWAESKPEGPVEKDNRIQHREFIEVTSAGATARLVTHNDWLSEGAKICEDQRRIVFGLDEHGRWIDFAVDVSASEGKLTLGDTKEGSFGVRVAGTMDVDANLRGRILNSRGQSNDAAWGQSAEWVDYHGFVDGMPVGIAIFDMPDSFRHPTKWHVRTYGLFAANPFGQRDFPTGDPQQGAVTLPKGKSIRLHYRVLFYRGELSLTQLTGIHREYSTSVVTAIK